MTALVGQMLRHLRVRRVDEAQDADRATALLQSHRYGAIVLSDRLLPIDGLELVRALRRATAGLNRDTPVIMMSVEPMGREIAAARDAGVTEFLGKPFAARDLGARLRAIRTAPRTFVETGAYTGPDRRRRRIATRPDRRRGPPLS